MRKLTILTIATAAILVAAAVANVVFFPIPLGPIRACPFGAIWAVIWPKAISAIILVERQQHEAVPLSQPPPPLGLESFHPREVAGGQD